MLQSLLVLNSDRVNKYGHILSMSGMEDMLWRQSTEVIPMNIGHDMHRPVGVMIPFGLYFEPNMVRSLGLSLIPENDDEDKQISDLKEFSFVKSIKEVVDENNNKLFKQVENYIEAEFKYLCTGTLSILNDSIVKRVFKELVVLQDKDGLISIEDINKFFTYKYQGVFFHNKLPLCIYSHSFFRRSLSRHNNFHYFFLDELMSMRNNNDITIKISLDWDLIGYSPNFLGSMEYEYWFGPKYTNDISNIQKGLTKYSCSEFEREYYGISATEFLWKDNSGLKEFELEELRQHKAPTFEDFFGCRYIHSIYDTSQETFTHFDGAIRGYNHDLYLERINKNMTDFGKKSQYTKLFRVDGKLELKNWKSLITNYMQDNPLIYEYFGIEKPKSELNKEPYDKSLMQQLVPYSMDKSDGIKLLLSYHKKNDNYENISHSISIYDLVNIKGEYKSSLEDEIIEVKKALNRFGKDLNIKDDILFGHFNDEYWNIPCIFHGNEDPTDDIQITLKALSTIFSSMINRGLNTIVSFTVAWNMEDKEVRVSCLGHIENLYNWIEKFKVIPVERDGLKKWLGSQRTYLNETFEECIDKPLLQDVCQFDGVLYIKREMVGEEFKLEPLSDEKGLSYKFIMPTNK